MFTILIAGAFLFAFAFCMRATPPGDPVGTAAETHPFSIHDMLAMNRLSDLQLSPDRQQLVYVQRVTDLEKDKGRTDLWLVQLDGGGLRQLTTHEAGSSHPRWSPDGRSVFFLSGRGGSSQVWQLPVDGGEAQQITNEPLDVAAFAVSPNGTKLALAMEVFPGSSPTETKARLDEEEKRKSSGRIYDELLFRHWDTWKDGRRAHVFIRPVEGGDLVDIMGEIVADVPSKPFGGAEEFTFTPDSRELVFAARNVGREEAWSTKFNLYAAPVDGSAVARCLNEDHDAWLTYPCFAPDGKTFAYLAMRRAGYESDRLRIVVQEGLTGTPRWLTEDWDRSAGGITWSPDSKTIYTAADNVGHHPLFAVDVASGDVRTVQQYGKVTGVVAADSRVVFALCHHRSPAEIYTTAPDGSGLTQITHANREQLATVRMGESEQFSFTGALDEEVWGWIVKPIDFDPKRKYPVAFLIHGGPQGSFGADFHYRWNPQAYAGAGYAAIMIDFHGSTGYGQAFTDAINHNWGSHPFEDLQKGLAAALKKYDWLDGDRVAALGASFGGYMINWIAGQWPDRFRCFVNHDGNLDERMAYYDTEELWFPEWERGGPPWEQPEEYTRHNPIDHVDKWRTPMLVIHGQKDYRVVDTQGMSTFTALQRRGIPSRFLYFPDENHWCLKPNNSIQWHETVLAWLDQWTKG
jgi:dipeptidyl aminopeptidase/acylaminoacyl peptidase